MLALHNPVSYVYALTFNPGPKGVEAKEKGREAKEGRGEEIRGNRKNGGTWIGFLCPYISFIEYGCALVYVRVHRCLYQHACIFRERLMQMNHTFACAIIRTYHAYSLLKVCVPKLTRRESVFIPRQKHAHIFLYHVIQIPSHLFICKHLRQNLFAYIVFAYL